MSLDNGRLLCLVLLAVLAVGQLAAYTERQEGNSIPPQFDVLTRSYRLNRNAVNHQEQVLHPGNVEKDSFGRLFSRKVDGHVYAQVLYAHDVQVEGVGVKNLIFVATMSNKVYAFDADDPEEDNPVWVTDLGPPVPMSDNTLGQKCVIEYNMPQYRDIHISVGIVSTPVIDRSTHIMYVVNKNKDGSDVGSYKFRIRGIDIRSGRTVLGPKIVDLEVPGTGVGSEGGRLRLYPPTHLQRSSLALFNNTVYFGFGAYCDTNPYHGWVAGYDATTLELSKVWCSTPNDREGSVWNSGEAITIDETTGHLLISTANGVFDAGRKSYGSALVILDSNQTDEDGMMKVVGYSKPDDDELGLLGVLHMPETGYIATAGKNNMLWVVDPSKMTMDGDSSRSIVQTIETAKHVHGTPVWWKRQGDGKRFVYLWGMYENPKQYELVDDGAGKQLLRLYSGYDGHPFSSFPGGIMVLSSDGKDDESAIVWGYTPIGEQLFSQGDSNQNIVRGQLYAFDANRISTLLWHSEQVPDRDGIEHFAKFNKPIVVTGRVFIPTFSDPPSPECFVHVYGLLKPVLLKQLAVYEDPGNRSQVVLKVLATGRPPLRYQWYRRTPTGETQLIEGATGKEVIMPYEEWRGAHGGTQQYWAEISNDYGSVTTESIESDAEVLPNPDGRIPPPTKDGRSSGSSCRKGMDLLSFTIMAMIMLAVLLASN